jgi:ADP-ribose pyrophosphatase YjhB (NUDIX family)
VKVYHVAVCGLEAGGRWPMIKFKRNVLAGYWGIPGGKYDDAEFLPEAAEREMAEEIEQPVRFDRFLAVVDELVISSDETRRVVMTVCRMELVHPPKYDVIDKAEGRIEWFTPAEIRARRSEWVPSDLRMLEDILIGGNTGYFKCRLNLTVPPPVLEEFAPVKSAG